MAVRNRSTQLSYTDEVNSSGVATQVELDDALTQHVINYHNGEQSFFENGNVFFLDPVTGLYLSQQFFSVEFFSHKSAIANKYMDHSKLVSSDHTPWRLPFNNDVMVVKVQSDLDTAAQGALFDIETDAGNVIHTVNFPSSLKQYDEDINVQVPAGTGLMAYINGVSVDRPRVALWLRLVYSGI